ncbi:aminoglycoside phosphotransferase family protein [Nocardia callitridis]|uniref:Aminoglycoside phosphotransferase family protein n=1 Tax=Nocardia callitridis TaxID=648753 RepID=A0ABP9KG71_9NOCA
MLDIPEGFASATIAREGEPGSRWIAALPGLIEELTRRWSCTPEGQVWHGQVGVVVPVRSGDLAPAVLKVSFPHPGNVHEPDAFEVWGGSGAVRLFRRDDAVFAMLLERAGEGSLAGVEDFDAAVAALGELSRRLAVPAPEGLPRIARQMPEWEHEITTTARELGSPMPQRVLDAAVATVREFGGDQPNTLVHGDLHDSNVLPSQREPWLVVDPKGYVGDPAYDAITVVRSLRFLPLLNEPDPERAVRRGLDLYCEGAGIDRTRARRWVQAGAVRSALWGRRYDEPSWAIEVTDRLAEMFTE